MCLETRASLSYPLQVTPRATQSVLVRTSNGQNLILAQDACYTLENMFASIPPGLAVDIPDSMVNIYHLKAMTVLGAQLVPPHDPDWWQGKPLGPQEIKNLNLMWITLLRCL